MMMRSPPCPRGVAVPLPPVPAVVLDRVGEGLLFPLCESVYDDGSSSEVRRLEGARDRLGGAGGEGADDGGGGGGAGGAPTGDEERPARMAAWRATFGAGALLAGGGGGLGAALGGGGGSNGAVDNGGGGAGAPGKGGAAEGFRDVGSGGGFLPIGGGGPFMDAEDMGRGWSLGVFRRLATDGIVGTVRPGMAGAAPGGGLGAVGGLGALLLLDDDSESDMNEEPESAGDCILAARTHLCGVSTSLAHLLCLSRPVSSVSACLLRTSHPVVVPRRQVRKLGHRARLGHCCS